MIAVDYCCFDASAFSFGFASAHSNTLILEKSENALSDYVNGIIPSRIEKVPITDKSKAFADFLKKCGCLSDRGVLDSPSLAPAAAEYALSFNILLGVRVVSWEKTDDGYNILVHTNSGLQNIICKEIVNRPTVISNIKFLNCVVSGTDIETVSKIEESGAIVNRSFEKDEFIISMPFDMKYKLNEARIEFVKKMRECFGTSVQIDAFATDFIIGSASHDIIEDFEAGVTFDL